MEAVDVLDKEFRAQNFTDGERYGEILSRYKDMARSYAQIENAIAVLSDLRNNKSYIYYGGFSQTLGIDTLGKEGVLSSIWEEEIFRLIHPDDLVGKHSQELCFYYFIKRQLKKKRTFYYLASKLRMKSRDDAYISALHRIFYITYPTNDALWLALCIYSPLVFDMPAKYLIVNSANGQMTELERQDNGTILSVREKQVLGLIDKGFTSKGIADSLNISINTVSRHRQCILAKLQVKNSIEACRVAKDLRLI